MGRPAGSADKLEARRLKAISLIEHDELSQAEAARRLKVDVRTVRKWIEWHRGNGSRGVEARPTPGRPPRLDAKSRKKLERILLKGPRDSGFDADLWTCARVAAVVHREFGIRFHKDHVGRILRQMGWSMQKPESRAIERDEKKIRRWVRESWPAIKKKPKNSAQP
jgi:transposase